MKIAVLKAEEIAEKLSEFAVAALLEEVQLSPKPGLVDRGNNGSHHDLTLELMERSARVLKSTFYEMAVAAAGKQPSQQLREQLAAIGRYGEQKMLQATGYVNTHKGAIWTLGLLTGAAGLLLTDREGGHFSPEDCLQTAGAIATYKDRYMPVQPTNGCRVRKRYGVRTAREEAVSGFPSLSAIAFPAWEKYAAEPATVRQLNVLLALMAAIDDTCILHRSNLHILRNVQLQAAAILERGGLGLLDNHAAYVQLDAYVTRNWVSPGGSADLLAATIFVQKITQFFKS